MLEVKDIKLTLDDGTPTTELSLIAEDGQMLCLTSASNDLPSRLLRVFLGLEAVASGFVSIEGELLTPSSAKEFRKAMAYLPEGTHMPCNTMKETVLMMAGMQANVQSSITPADVAEQTKRLGLPDDLLTTPQEKLTPQEERLMMTALMGVWRKKTILMDNPTRGLDGAAAQSVAQYLRSLADNGAAVVVATDDINVTRMAQRTISLG